MPNLKHEIAALLDSAVRLIGFGESVHGNLNFPVIASAAKQSQPSCHFACQPLAEAQRGNLHPFEHLIIGI